MIKPNKYQQIDIDILFNNYRFTDKDILVLQQLKPIAENNLEHLIEEFYSFLFSFQYAKIFLNQKDILDKHEKGIKEWFLKLFSGQYDQNYFQYLFQINETHVKIGLPPHYINTAFSFIREFLVNMLIKYQKEDAIFALHKIIDINLDILSLSYNQEDQEQLINEIVLIKHAINNNSIIPFVQPIVDAKNNTTNKFESLMRIPDANGNILYPIYPILQTAKNVHLYHELMKQMIRKTFDIFRDLDYSFSINISYEDISNIHFCDFLQEQLQTINNPNRVIFEILETDVIIDFQIVLDFISHIKTFGSQIAIDDFGSGYSSIENILKLKPDYIKIDGSLIKNIDTSMESYTVVKSIITMAKELNAKTIAEFVHNQAVYQTLQQLEVDYLQGYHTGIPFSSTELLDI